MTGKTNIMYLKIVFVTLIVGVNNSDSFMVKTQTEFLNIRIFNDCEVLIKNSVTRVTVWHHVAC